MRPIIGVVCIILLLWTAFGCTATPQAAEQELREQVVTQATEIAQLKARLRTPQPTKSSEAALKPTAIPEATPSPTATPLPTGPGTIDTPVALGVWHTVAPSVEIRVLSLQVSETYHYMSLVEKAPAGMHYYLLQVEGRFNGNPGDSFSFDQFDWCGLNAERQLMRTVDAPDPDTSFFHTVFGGGTTKGEVPFMDTGLTGVFYQSTNQQNSRVWFTLPKTKPAGTAG